MFKHVRMTVLAASVASAAALGLTLAGMSVAAGAATDVSATTTVVHDLDSPAWAVDSFSRVLSVTDGTDCGVVPATYACYDATITDSGTFTTRVNQFSPNQSGGFAGEHIVSPAVTSNFSGGGSYIIISDTTPDASNVQAYVNDHYSHPSSGATSTDGWALQAFPGHSVGEAGSVTLNNTWSWTYATACQKWVDSFVNGDGGLPADGNITGVKCVTLPDLLYLRVKVANADLASLGLNAHWNPPLSDRIAGKVYNVKPFPPHGSVPVGSTVNLRDGLRVHN